MEPNFFLVGGPKCGTTAIAQYLREHPRIFISEPKEPFYLADELTPMAAKYGIRNKEDYRRIFAPADPRHHVVIGEASTLYLSSPSALESIRNQFPAAKIVAVVRDPVDVAHAFHMQMCLTFHEDEQDFEKAWSLQDSRSEGRNVPARCEVPRLLQYREIAALGTQLEKLTQVFEPHQVLILSFKEFSQHPGLAYQKILDFVGLPADGRTEFPRVNESTRHRWVLMNQLYQSSPLLKFRTFAKRSLPSSLGALIRPLPRLILRRKAGRAVLSKTFRSVLDQYFADESAKMHSILSEHIASRVSGTD